MIVVLCIFESSWFILIPSRRKKNNHKDTEAPRRKDKRMCAMAQCNRKDLSEVLLRALSPKDRPEDVPGLLEHVQECPRCAKELEIHRNVRAFVQRNRAALEAAFSECPDAGALVQFAADGMTDHAVSRHVDSCRQCQDELGLIQDLGKGSLDTNRVPDRLAVAQWGFVRSKVEEVYGPPPVEHRGFLQRLVRGAKEFLHVPSLAAGALAAALVLLVVLPRPGADKPFNVELSDVSWAQRKEPGADKVAIVILVGKGSSLPPNEIGNIYKELYKAEGFNPSLAFITPADLKQAVAGAADNVHDLNSLRKTVLAATHARYLLAFNIGAGQAPMTVKASLLDREHDRELSAIVQTGVGPERLQDRIQSMAVDLLSLVDTKAQ